MTEYKDLDYGSLGLLKNEFKLVGAYPIDEEIYNSLSDGNSNQSINTTALRGVPTCPCCGAQLGVVVCECGNIMCSDGIRQLALGVAWKALWVRLLLVELT